MFAARGKVSLKDILREQIADMTYEDPSTKLKVSPALKRSLDVGEFVQTNKGLGRKLKKPKKPKKKKLRLPKIGAGKNLRVKKQSKKGKE